MVIWELQIGALVSWCPYRGKLTDRHALNREKIHAA
jgi:hypothetical protein